MKTLLIAAALLASTAVADAGQALFNNGAGFRYTRPMPNPGQWYASPAVRYYAPAPVPRYYPPYLRGYVQPWRPDPGAAFGAALLGTLAATLPRVAAVPLPPQRPAQGDAIDQIVDPVTRADVVSALERLCAMADDPICAKLSRR
jgi:hypothetical protein